MLEMMKLPFAYNALEPYMDAKTVEIHYDKHHRTYLDNLNKIVAENNELKSKSLEDIIASVNILPVEIQRAVGNNAGQVYNHNKFWESLSPTLDQKPSGILAEKIEKKWGSLDKFKEEWKKIGLAQFGSGWVFLIVNESTELEIVKSSNADGPIFRRIVPLLTMDVWEHAYYLNYQNKRGEYIENFFKIINWEKVGQNYISSK
ncbi:MAG: superoxide dismutase [Patescibacteria group bacterium]